MIYTPLEPALERQSASRFSEILRESWFMTCLPPLNLYIQHLFMSEIKTRHCLALRLQAVVTVAILALFVDGKFKMAVVVMASVTI